MSVAHHTRGTELTHTQCALIHFLGLTTGPLCGFGYFRRTFRSVMRDFV